MSMKGHVRACHQIKEASKQTEVTSKMHAKVLVQKLRKRANMTTNGTCKGMSSNYGSKQRNRRDFEKERKSALPQNKEASKHDHEGACKGLS